MSARRAQARLPDFAVAASACILALAMAGVAPGTVSAAHAQASAAVTPETSSSASGLASSIAGASNASTAGDGNSAIAAPANTTASDGISAPAMAAPTGTTPAPPSAPSTLAAPSAAMSATASSTARNTAPNAIGSALAAQTLNATHPNIDKPASAGKLSIGSDVPALGLGGIAQAVFGLIVVIGLVFACGWIARRMGLKPTGARRGGVINVIGSASLGTRERVVVVDVAGQWLVLGVAPGSVRRLHTMPAPLDPSSQLANSADIAAGTGSSSETHASNQEPTAREPSFKDAFTQQLRDTFSSSNKGS